MVFRDEVPPERIAADRRALGEALTKLWEVQRRLNPGETAGEDGVVDPVTEVPG